MPYKAVDEIVDALTWYLVRLPPGEAAALLPAHAAALAQLFPVLQRVRLVAEAVQARRGPAPPPRELRLRAFATLRELLAGIARRHPLALSIDDLQWADADSLALLAELMAPPAPPGLLLLATVRAPAGAAGAPGLLPEAHHLHLAGLPPGEARELAEALLAREPEEAGERRRIAAVIAEESGGHPLFIDELVRRRALGAAPEAPRLDEALAARVGELAPGERAVLELVAIAGAPLAREVAAAAGDLGFDELARRVASLRAASLVRGAATPSGPAVEPSHDRVRRVVLARLAPDAQRGLHLRLAEALETRGADAETLAVHFHEAGEARRAAPWAAVAAARAAAALAFARAASLFRMAAAHEPAGTPEGRRLRVGLAEAPGQRRPQRRGRARLRGGRGRRRGRARRRAAAPRRGATPAQWPPGRRARRHGARARAARPRRAAPHAAAGARLARRPARARAAARAALPRAARERALRRGARPDRHLLLGGRGARDRRSRPRRRVPGPPPAPRARRRRAVPHLPRARDRGRLRRGRRHGDARPRGAAARPRARPRAAHRSPARARDRRRVRRRGRVRDRRLARRARVLRARARHAARPLPRRRLGARHDRVHPALGAVLRGPARRAGAPRAAAPARCRRARRSLRRHEPAHVVRAARPPRRRSARRGAPRGRAPARASGRAMGSTSSTTTSRSSRRARSACTSARPRPRTGGSRGGGPRCGARCSR